MSIFYVNDVTKVRFFRRLRKCLAVIMLADATRCRPLMGLSGYARVQVGGEL